VAGTSTGVEKLALGPDVILRPMKVGFVGAGNMAHAMARGWAGAERGPEAMAFRDIDRRRAEALAEDVGGSVAEDAEELVAQSELVVLAVKPAALDDAAAELAPAGPPAVLSILAATPLARLREAFPGVPVIRAMPNQPVEVRRGVLCYAPPDGVPDELAEQVIALFGELGVAVPVEEPLIDPAMAVMSSSPAYLALVAELLAEAGARQGLDPELASRLVADTMAGTAELLWERDAAEIRRRVAPPGGATEAGLEALERGGLHEAIASAVDASLARFR
jgi:pyrroline-5-carboxylate reductase